MFWRQCGTIFPFTSANKRRSNEKSTILWKISFYLCSLFSLLNFSKGENEILAKFINQIAMAIRRFEILSPV